MTNTSIQNEYSARNVTVFDVLWRLDNSFEAFLEEHFNDQSRKKSRYSDDNKIRLLNLMNQVYSKFHSMEISFRKTGSKRNTVRVYTNLGTEPGGYGKILDNVHFMGQIRLNMIFSTYNRLTCNGKTFEAYEIVRCGYIDNIRIIFKKDEEFKIFEVDLKKIEKSLDFT